MRIIVISDTHQYYRNFETIVLRNPDADMFLHLGDGESEYQLLCRNMPEVADKFRYVKGNCDYGSDAPLTELIDVAPNHRILATHGHRYRVNSTLDYLEQDIGKGLDRGFSSFKIKIGGAAVSQDLERIAFCRRLIGPDRRLMVDAFCAYEADVIIPMAKKFEQYDIGFLEEPVALDDIPGCAYVAANVSMPVALGESHYTMAQFRDIINSKAARILQPDVAYVGGITGFMQYAGIAAYHGLRLAPHWCHDLSVQLALSIPQIRELEYMDQNSALFLIQKVIANPVTASNGIVRAPEGAGHGLVLDEKAVERYLA